MLFSLILVCSGAFLPMCVALYSGEEGKQSIANAERRVWPGLPLLTAGRLLAKLF